MHNHAKNGFLDGVERELADGADVNVQCPSRWTPLHYASRAGDLNIVKLLLDSGAHLEAVNDMGETPLIIACKSGQYEIIQYLLDAGAHPSHEAQNIAFKMGYSDITELIESYEYPVKSALDN